MSICRFISVLGVLSSLLFPVSVFADGHSICQTEIAKAQNEISNVIRGLHNPNEMNEMRVFQEAYAALDQAKAKNSIAQADKAMTKVIQSLHSPVEMKNLSIATRLEAKLSSISQARCQESTNTVAPVEATDSAVDSQSQSGGAR